MRSDLAGVVLGEGLVPEDEGALAEVVIVANGLALGGDSLLGTFLEVFGLLVASGGQHALQKHFLVLFAAWLVLEFGGPHGVVQGLEDFVDEAKEFLVRHINY